MYPLKETFDSIMILEGFEIQTGSGSSSEPFVDTDFSIFFWKSGPKVRENNLQKIRKILFISTYVHLNWAVIENVLGAVVPVG